ncbi:MAG: lysophospholipid acyltransferase family protein [Pseudomonadota bacterium]
MPTDREQADLTREMRWDGAPQPVFPKPTAPQKIGMGLRGAALLGTTFALTPFVLLFQLIERWLPGSTSRRIIRFWAHTCLRLCGLKLIRKGQPMQGPGAIVANHTGYLDIFTHLAADDVYFVSTADVRHWPLVGPFSTLVRPVYIERRRTAAKAQETQLRERLLMGHRLAFFPEGTSTDGRRVLPFKSSLFSVFFHEDLADAQIQPVTLAYKPPSHLPPDTYGWWGTKGLGDHISTLLALSRQGAVEVTFHPPLAVAGSKSRKNLAALAWQATAEGLPSNAT